MSFLIFIFINSLREKDKKDEKIINVESDERDKREKDNNIKILYKSLSLKTKINMTWIDLNL